MADFIVIGVLFLMIGMAVAYLVRAKKRGVKCVGCPSGTSCSHNGNGQCSGTCNCHSDTNEEG